MSRAVLSIGSNLGDRLANLQSVLDGVAGSVQRCSGVYQTAPWGGVAQQDYLNAVLVVQDRALGAWDWLRRGQELEQAAGRERVLRWGARTLDVDVLVCDGVLSTDPALTLPHPRAHERAFVLLPWSEIEPEAVLPGHGRVADLVAALSPQESAGVRRYTAGALVRR